MNTSTLIKELDKQIARLSEARDLLADNSSGNSRGRSTRSTGRKTRTLSEEARAKMAAAQKRRWAAYRRKKK